MTGLIVSREKPNSENTLRLFILAFGIIAVGVVLVIWMLMGGAYNVGWWKTLGYPGVFILSLLASGGMVFLIPSLAATCGAAGLGLNLMLVGFIGGLGETVGEMSGYCIGYGGQGAFTNRSFYKRARGWNVMW